MNTEIEKKCLVTTLRSFVDTFDGFLNEFQYDFLIDNFEHILDFDIIDIDKYGTYFNFKESQSLGITIGPEFFLSLNEMPFLFIKLNSKGYYRLRQDVQDLLISRIRKDDKFYIPAARPTYKQMLQMEEWQIRRNEVISFYGGKCMRCGSQEKLQVHHKLYRKSAYAWDYEMDELECICNGCHFDHHKIENNANSLDSDLFSLHIPSDMAARIMKKVEVISYMAKTFTDPFLLMVANEGNHFDISKGFYIIDVKHVRKRKFITHEMIIRHITKINILGVTYKNNILRISRL